MDTWHNCTNWTIISNISQWEKHEQIKRPRIFSWFKHVFLLGLIHPLKCSHTNLGFVNFLLTSSWLVFYWRLAFLRLALDSRKDTSRPLISAWYRREGYILLPLAFTRTRNPDFQFSLVISNYHECFGHYVVMVNVLDCNLKISEVDPSRAITFTFGLIPLGKAWTPLFPHLWVK